MRQRLVRLLLCTLTALAVTVPASADHGGIHPTTRTERVYFTCTGDTKVQNVAGLNGQTPGWSTAAPSGSVEDGAGCGHAAGPFAFFDVAWAGEFAGNLETLTVELHSVSGTFARLLQETSLTFALEVDGQVLYSDIEGDVPNDIAVEPSESEITHTVRFSFTHLPFMVEDGDGEQVRDIRLSVGSWEFPAEAWVWDTTETPAGITFNPAKLAPYRIKV